MELNWTTFFLEIINFLVLVWLLKRFFYQPILGVIEKRRSSIEQSVEETHKQKQEAERLEQQYKNRLHDWEREKKQKLLELQQEIHLERERKMQAVTEELQESRQKAEFLLQQQREKIQHQADLLGLNNASRFLHQLLKDFSGPELNNKITGKMIVDLRQLSDEKKSQLQNTLQDANTGLKIISAFELAENVKLQLQQVLNEVLDKQLTEWQFAVDQNLIAGTRVQIGPLVLRANLLDELEFFTEFEHVG